MDVRSFLAHHGCMPRRVRVRSPVAFVRHRRRVRRTVAASVTIVLALLIVLDRQGWLLVSRDDLAAYHGQSFRVVRVIDGDTLDVAAPDGASPTTRVRLWGVDTPEVAKPELGVAAEPGAEAATQFTTQLARDAVVTLELEPHRLRGRYGRLLAYVRLPDGTMLNEQLLLAGLARADDRWPHQFAERFAMLELQARRERVGLWTAP